MNKRYERLIFSISSLFIAYACFKEIALIQKHFIIGIVISFIFLMLALMWLDLCGLLKIKINKNYNPENYKYIDLYGMLTVLYLFVKAVI